MGRFPCCEGNNFKKGPWMPEEDQKLVDYVQKHGHGSWTALSKHAGLNRCGKSCRLRWHNYLRPDIKRGKFSDEEEQIIINLHSVLGNKWSRIATHLPGRTDNEIKNFWNTHLRKKLLRMGIDPKSHKPICDLNVFANLSQLLSASNLGTLMNPWENALRLRADATQLANTQLLQSIWQVLNTSPLPNIEETSLLGSTELLNPIMTLPPSHGYHAADGANPLACFEGGFNPEVQSLNNNSLNNIYDIRTENSIPALASLSPSFGQTYFVNQMESKMNPTYLSPHSPTSTSTSTIFETWEKLMGDEANCSWKDIIQ
ncbi:hypothetical protein F0562_012654 [Nyssa sinensis]|uniref:Transcription factor MYB39 n=1 Tax=Nyssa sinensis TaxID=561372 RepID=A0A5J4ZX95_9ASTE|nr:hypothetical protein F0562_012654 [Nyssa sinensis]